MATSKRTTRRSSGAQSETGAAPAPDAAAPPAAKPRTRKPRAKPSAARSGDNGNHQDRHALIAHAAYLRSLGRGFQPGFELEDWLAAEAEVDHRLGTETRAS
jgi:hypothetical protein